MGQAIPFAAGAGTAAFCGTVASQLEGRFCHLGGAVEGCADLDGCGDFGDELTVTGKVIMATVPHGIIGVFRDNEAVVAIRAHTLPYTQAIGSRRGTAPKESNPSSFNSNVDSDEYDFAGFPFVLPRTMVSHEVVVAFGTRSVMRVPLLGASAPKDFSELGMVRRPVSELLRMPQPVTLPVSIIPNNGGNAVIVTVTFSLGLSATEEKSTPRPSWQPGDVSRGLPTDQIYRSDSNNAGWDGASNVSGPEYWRRAEPNSFDSTPSGFTGVSTPSGFTGAQDAYAEDYGPEHVWPVQRPAPHGAVPGTGWHAAQPMGHCVPAGAVADHCRVCVVCNVNPPSHIVIRCGHQCICGPCAHQLRLYTPRAWCPMCGQFAEDFLQVR